MEKHSCCDVYLIRHGETDWNLQGKLQGNSDIPLNEEGKRQALLIREKLKDVDFSAAFSSDFSRARKTAEAILGPKEVPIVETLALRERYMGVWEGRLISELKEWIKKEGVRLDAMTKEEYLSYKWYEEVESYSEIFERVKNLLKVHSASYLGSSMLLSSHAGVLRAVLYSLDFREGWRWQVSNCAIVKLQVNQNGEIVLVECDGANLKKEVIVTF
jgi:2,3-bisphosphoglycerate-dependent phosphoglycerate mutase